MRIAIIGQKGIPALFGGIERHVEELSVRLAAHGHDVTVYTRPYFTSPYRKRYMGVNLVSLPSFRTKHLDAISHTFIATLHAITHRYDIIHYHGVGPSLVSFLPRLLGSRAKVITTFHCIDRYHQKWGFLARIILAIGEWSAVHVAHKTIVVSKTLQAYARKVYGRQTHYIPNGVERPRTMLGKQYLATFGLRQNGYILAVARLIPHKGIHHLIRAYKQIPTNKKLVIVGGSFHTDAYERMLRASAEGDPRIVFTGFQSGPVLRALYSNAYLFVQPSEAEGLPIVLLEAASFGKGILASNIPEHQEVFDSTSGVMGFSFKNKNVGDLRKQLSMLMMHPALLRKAGDHARNVVLKHYNWTSVAREVEALYASAFESDSKKSAPMRKAARSLAA